MLLHFKDYLNELCNQLAEKGKTAEHAAFAIVYDLDEIGNVLQSLFGNPAGVFGQKGETISSALGKYEAIRRYQNRNNNKYVFKWPLRYKLQEIESDICNIFQAYHGLKSIEWNNGICIEKKYPGIKNWVEEFIKNHDRS